VRVWLDDRRPPYPDPDSWIWVRTPAEAIELLETGEVSELSLDHDLGLVEGDRELTGYDVVAWMERAVATRGFEPPRTIRVHSSNAPAAARMEHGIEAIRHLAERSVEEDR
jgi:hypothetical protein